MEFLLVLMKCNIELKCKEFLYEWWVNGEYIEWIMFEYWMEFGEWLWILFYYEI